LHDYLLSFVKRTQPLVDIQTKHQEAEVEFYQKWDDGDFVDWDENKSAKRLANADGAGQGMWCSACQSGHLSQRIACVHVSIPQARKAIQRRPFMTPT
jgi:splicing factor 3A subunit 3